MPVVSSAADCISCWYQPAKTRPAECYSTFQDTAKHRRPQQQIQFHNIEQIAMILPKYQKLKTTTYTVFQKSDAKIQITITTASYQN